MKSTLYTANFSTPIGEMYGLATDDGICLLEFAERKELKEEIASLKDYFKSEILDDENDHLLLLHKELHDYFKGKLQKFTVPTLLIGTDFQVSVWESLKSVPYAETRSYLEQTESIGEPNAIRAVATANGKNKLAIIIPCHRIIGSDGSLTGYAGGIDRKRFLLNLEREVAGPKDLFSA
ncbi:methylated-DNA--[protein]-cysteine S-methyltransferase [Crocinitomix catalasitica]|uniref:methylated-DNA--[protein]-cysteine S-methyltransferase n=1 Tax=Crocinitomix catalasitica TaxID=184607 RepID=UPI000489292E|nr:methylated-DNA--[protein]-cysteine S-methyltransferase [Crocinitomix catalasitica]